MFQKYKNLSIGDLVKFQNVYVHDGLRISGAGEIIQIYESGHHMFAWIQTEEGPESIACENLTKI